MGYRKHIRLSSEDAAMFTMVASNCDFDIILSSLRCTCDGKNLEDVRMLDFTKEFVVEYNGYDSVFEQYMGRLQAV